MLSKVKQAARKILGRYGYSVPIDIEAIVKAEGILLQKENLEAEVSGMLVIKENSKLPGDRAITVNPYPNGTSGFIPNSIKIDQDNGKLLAYIDSFITQAEDLYDPANTKSTNSNIRVETFTESGTGKVIYLCYNQ